MSLRALLSFRSCAVCAAIIWSIAPAAGEKVGVAAAVNPTATGHQPGQPAKQLQIGSDILHSQRIQTSSAGSTQVMFVDRSTLTVSPNADVTIDRYVFNPSTNTGDMAINMGKGLMRFVGGQISHSGGARVSTPSATLGIRGGIAMINSANGKTSVVHLYGTTTVSTGKNSVTITKPGFFTEASGGILSLPIQSPPGLLASYNAQLQSKPGQTGGSPPGKVTSDKVKTAVGQVNGGGNTPSAQQFQVTDTSLSQPGQPNAGGGGGGGGPGPGPGPVSGPPWGLLVAPGQTGIHTGPPGQVLQGLKGHGNPNRP